MMRNLKTFFNKKNLVGILIAGLAGFLVLAYTGLGEKIISLINSKILRRG
jgi:hypothetical protein